MEVIERAQFTTVKRIESAYTVIVSFIGFRGSMPGKNPSAVSSTHRLLPVFEMK